MKDYPPYLDYPKERKPMTNYDLLISKTPEELALFIHNAEAQAADIGGADTVESWLDWLKSPVDKEETE